MCQSVESRTQICLDEQIRNYYSDMEQEVTKAGVVGWLVLESLLPGL